MAVVRKTVQPESVQSQMAQTDDSVAVAGVNKESRFLKEQLYMSVRYTGKKDLVEALLEDGRGYTIEEADNIIAEYLHRKER